MLYIYLINNLYSLVLMLLLSIIIWQVLSRRLLIEKIFSLIAVFILLSFSLLVLGLEFLPLIILLVYVGAIAVLFLFVVMILNPDFQIVLEEKKELINFNSNIMLKNQNYFSSFILGIFLGVFLVINLSASNKYFIHYYFGNEQLYNSIFFDLGTNYLEEHVNHLWSILNYSYHPHFHDNKEIINIGSLLYTKYGIALLIIGVMLLVSMMGAIILTLRTTSLLKRQSIGIQTARYSKS